MSLFQSIWRFLLLVWSLLTCRRSESLQSLCQRAASSDSPYLPELIRRLAALGDGAKTENVGALQPVLTRHLDFLSSYTTEVQAHMRIKSTPYDQKNAEHEEQLRALWAALKQTPCPPPTSSKQWSEIGFQGENPATDFRGMGLLGLRQLLHFAQRDGGQRARSALSLSNHPVYWFPFACVGINITAWLLACFEANKLTGYFCRIGSVNAESFDQLYSDVLGAFASHYVHAKPPDIMSFKPIFESFCKTLEDGEFNTATLPAAR